MRASTFVIVVSLVSLQTSATAQHLAEAPTVDVTKLRLLSTDLSRGQLFEIAESKNAAGVSAPERARLFSLWGPFTFPYDTETDKIENKPRAPATFGIDISHHTPSNIPLQRLSENRIKFVYVKATQGKNFIDGQFFSFWNKLRQLPDGKKVYRGAFHFLTADDDALAQAKTFVAVLHSGGPGTSADMPPVVDLEWDIPKKGAIDRWASLSPEQIIQKVTTWLSYVKAQTGRTPMIYTSGVWWKERVGNSIDQSTLGDYQIWIADYSKSSRGIEEPFIPGGQKWVVWQFTDKSQLDSGFQHGLDANIVPGSEADFIARFALPRL